MVDIEREEAMEAAQAEGALREFEVEMGLVTPATTSIEDDEKELGPAAKETETN